MLSPNDVAGMQKTLSLNVVCFLLNFLKHDIVVFLKWLFTIDTNYGFVILIIHKIKMF